MVECDIVIIDTGIDLRHSIFKGSKKIVGFGVNLEKGELCITDHYNDLIGHGTAVSSIIFSRCPEARICVIKLFDQDFDIAQEYLLFALDFVEKNVKCKIINLSLGVLSYNLSLKKICHKLSEKGCIIVAAFDNNGAVSYPAAFKCVIGVEASYKCTRMEQIILLQDSMIDVLAYGYNYRVAWLNNSYQFVRGSSFSVAFVTTLLFNSYLYCRKIITGFEKAQIMLEKFSKRNALTSFEPKREVMLEIFPMNAAAIFPYNKEMHSVVNFSHMLSFKLKHVYDIKQSGRLNLKIRGIQSEEEYVIENIDDIVWSDIDALIIGHLDQIALGKTKDIKDKLIKKCLKHRINVYSFDIKDILKYVDLFRKRKLNITCPNPNKINIEKKLGKLYSIKTPVLGVFGTSSNQGKFTLQLQLRKYFLDDAYSVGQLGSEPSSLLFGMDKMLAYGYASHLKLDQMEMIEIINKLLHEIDKTEKDIIIVGGQAGSIPVFSFNLQYYNLYTLNFVMGTNPDAIVLCVNDYDSIEYISRCVNALTTLMDCKIIAFAISPLTIHNEWQRVNRVRVLANKNKLDIFKKDLKKLFGVNSYIIGTDEIKNLYDECLNFFS